MDFFHVKPPVKTIYAKIITTRAAVFVLRGVKGQGQYLFREKEFFHVKSTEKTIYAKIITIWGVVLYLRGIKGQGQTFFWLETDNRFFSCKIARENYLRYNYHCRQFTSPR